jgi:hypothetical protein
VEGKPRRRHKPPPLPQRGHDLVRRNLPRGEASIGIPPNDAAADWLRENDPEQKQAPKKKRGKR